MRLASFNVENMFDRVKAMNLDTWAEGRATLEAHQELNTLFNEEIYTAAIQARILKLLADHGLLRRDESDFFILRKLRGKLLNRRPGEVTVAAEGRASWIGWVELKTEPVKETATENTARVIALVNADVLGVVEAEDRTTLRLFNQRVLPAVTAAAYEHVMLIDGNDDRGIDVGILSRADYPILSIRSHVADRDDKGLVFSRDCAEFEIGLQSGGKLWVLVNHFKSKGYGGQAANDAKRKRQATRVRGLYDAHLATGHDQVAIIGDFNDTPDREPLAPLLSAGSDLRDISAIAGFRDGGRRGTHGNCTAAAKLDYILLSPRLFESATAAGIERLGMWGGKNGTLWPHFDEVKTAEDAASDHAAMWVDLAI